MSLKNIESYSCCSDRAKKMSRFDPRVQVIIACSRSFFASAWSSWPTSLQALRRFAPAKTFPTYYVRSTVCWLWKGIIYSTVTDPKVKTQSSDNHPGRPLTDNQSLTREPDNPSSLRAHFVSRRWYAWVLDYCGKRLAYLPHDTQNSDHVLKRAITPIMFSKRPVVRNSLWWIIDERIVPRK